VACNGAESEKTKGARHEARGKRQILTGVILTFREADDGGAENAEPEPKAKTGLSQILKSRKAEKLKTAN
jgi:hypothetical protein